ncbi:MULTISPECIES: glycoside hydrolase family 15 protein [unclassified Microbacterium]|uniref:glycoside hydrolase family 15 protein n=1 Tax=unclassified Microbacterium TaxID=2609290 RepID=UPI00214BD289|nr:MULTISPECIES: glycoside hydrolase family 15 protein [unclassified Microbacterium]MCR2783869.1 glycoside hydrolase family 15 protein [Microbacterium sp. zg.B96]WIM15285.1 glycoside hydrolase family 15 protein [Microbacterium sp. zg-B96]
MTCQPIESYAPIGDGRTVALVGSDGSIDWMPLPELTSDAVFARILDDSTGGCFELAPAAEFTMRRRYVPETNVLETTFTTADGVVRVTDALVSGVAGRLPWAELARRVDGVKGEVPMAWAVRPGTSLQTASPWIEQTPHGAVIRCGRTGMSVVGLDHGPSAPDDDGAAGPVLAGAFTTSPGSRHLVAIAATHDEPLPFPDPHAADEGIDRTIANWRMWSRVFSYDGPWDAHVQRSALALKLLIYSPTGAIAAAATTSLPESPRGGKNWDYRFAWVRDLAYTAHALVRFGLREETHAALSWMLQTIRAHGPNLHVMYTLDGALVPAPTTADVPGWHSIGPVVTGNPAKEQLQLGVYGDLMAICRTYVEAGNVLDTGTGRMLAGIADRACDLWRNPDSGMWELPELQHYTSSKMGCWKALDDAVWLAEAGVIPGSAARWQAERDRIREWIEQRCWSEERGAYVAVADGDDLDASVLLHAASGFDRGERMSRTIDALTAELGAGPLLYRFTGADQIEKTFVACAFWRAHAMACVGRHDEALELMDALVGTANDVGIYAEMIDETDGSAWGNTPQALSHLGFLSAALTIRELVPEHKLRGR